MKGNWFEDAVTDEDRCRIAGGLVERAFPEVDPALSVDANARLQAAWLGQGRAASSGGRRRFVVPAVVALAISVVVLVVLRGRPLRFDVQGARMGTSGSIEAAAEQPATVRFSDGTRIVLAGASVARVAERDADGAQVIVERGRARFDVVHRAGSRWRVVAGPFEIAVTGTSFDVDWPAARRQTLAIDLHAGSVVVRGSLAGAGVSLHAGQRLIADLDRGALSVVDSGEAPPVRAGEDPRVEDLPPAAGAPATPSSPAATPPFTDDHAHGGSARPRLGHATTLEPEPAGIVAAPGDERPPTEPPRLAIPALPTPSKLAAGGSACVEAAPQIRFDRGFGRGLEGIAITSPFALAFSHAALDRGRSWCGAGSLRVDARFDLAGAQNRFGDRPRHAGEVLIDLPAPIDLTDRTVTLHVFVEGPSDLRFGAQIFAVNTPHARSHGGDPQWVGAGFTPDLTTGRWWALSHRFERENRLFEGGTSGVDRVERLTLQVYAIGKDRVWTGRVFVDDVGWQ